MSAACGIHLEGTGKPTEVQISQCWVFNTAQGILVTVHIPCLTHTPPISHAFWPDSASIWCSQCPYPIGHMAVWRSS